MTNKRKKEDILKKPEEFFTEQYDLDADEKIQVASVIALVEQAREAQNNLLVAIINRVAERYEVNDAELSLNMPDIMERGAKYAKLIVKKPKV